MTCPDCHAPSRALNTRKRVGYLWRSYECANRACRHKFTTIEFQADGKTVEQIVHLSYVDRNGTEVLAIDRVRLDTKLQ